MDESKSETNINHGEWDVVHYIFCVMYEKIVFNVINNESVEVNGSKCLILLANIVVLLIHNIKNELPATFVSLGVIMYPSIIAVNLS
jgi:hypothetical protein